MASLWCLAGCKKEAAVAPSIDAAFNQSVTLRYQQRAALPNQGTPELTVTVDDVVDTRCPEGVNCLQPGDVQTVLGVRDQNGTGQVLTLQLEGRSSSVDSTAVQANGRQYTIVLQEVTPYPKTTDVAKKDKRVVLVVKRR
ncbi:hypothetical protein SAMN02746009_03693 [Hymenobacter psychrotolerans DSM 18569]|uniref:Uncharacterized protein n=2 Tax=Hymenobacter TaxID=89966 RepID=A0A1M7EVL3_9BACT|nr:hypothetical protein SAMN02746009_03693 [Hymenobacter psychrotolerans DSM 18569]